MKLLYVAPFFNLPPMDGASLRATNLLAHLTRSYKVVLLTYRPAKAEPLQQWCREKCVTLHFLTTQPVYGVKVNFLRRLISARLPGFGSHDRAVITSDVERLSCEEGPFDVLYLATQLMGQILLLRNWPTRRIVDLYDVYTPIAQTKHLVVPWFRPHHWLYRVEAWRIRRYESQILRRADQVLVASLAEVEAVKKLQPDLSVTVIPNGVNLPLATRPSVETQQVLMVGNYHYEPNIVGARWFYEHVWSKVRCTVPDAHLCFVGKNGQRLREGLVQITEDLSVSIVGSVPELAPYYSQSACAIVPILSGGGTRLKLLEAMAFGIPVVTTTKGAEGVEHRNTVTVADSAAAFAEGTLSCLLYPEKHSQATRRARQLVADHYSWSAIGRQLLEALSVR